MFSNIVTHVIFFGFQVFLSQVSIIIYYLTAVDFFA